MYPKMRYIEESSTERGMKEILEVDFSRPIGIVN